MTKLQQLLLSLIMLSASHFVLAQSTNGSRPNVIVILADDLGYGDVGFNREDDFPIDRGVIPTPEIDKLANSGIVCKNAHVAHPFCGPSRAALLTGMLPHRIGAQYNLPNDITTPLGIPVNETYFTTVLQDSDYNTAAFGKWHLGFTEGSYQPLDRGFDYFFGFLGGGKNYFESIYEDAFYNRLDGDNPVTNEYQDPVWRNRAYVDRNEFSNTNEEDYLTDVITDDAITYIQSISNSSDPYFMYLSYNAPHTPLQVPAAEEAQFKLDNPNFESLISNSTYITESTPVEKVDDPAEKQELIDKFVDARITYATMVSNMDTNIGRLVTELKKDMTKFNNTVIIFLSDNGGYTHSKGAVNYPLDAGKGSVRDGGHKVPMFVSWPDKISPATYDHQISSLDIYPTLIGLAGESVPAGKIIDGVDFMDAMIDGDDARPDEGLLVMRPQNGFHNGAFAYENYKIVKTANGGQWNLYDISTDPGESTNIRSQSGGEEIVQDILDKAITLVKDFKDVKPAWYDNAHYDSDGDGEGDTHVHDPLWKDGTLPGYDRLFESPLLKLEGELSIVSISGTSDAIEGGTNGIFKVSLPEDVLATEDIDISYSISGEATNGVDYSTISGTITILDATNSSEISINAIEDGIDETSETVILTLTGISTGTVNETPAQITIYDVINPTTLTAGDIALTGWKAGSGKIGFVLLKDISATTKISISNRTWSNGSSQFTGDYSVDDIWTWSAGEALAVGDHFILDSDGLVKRVNMDSQEVVGTTSHDHTGKAAESSDGDFDLSTNGDGILFFQADPFALPTDASASLWITGLHTGSGWGLGGGNSYCELPTALTNGLNANQVGEKHNYGVYTGALSGTAAELRASINDSSNWLFSEDTEYNLWKYNEIVNGVSGNIGSEGELSVNEEFSRKLQVYPNPSNGYFYFTIAERIQQMEVEVLSASGRLIKKIQVDSRLPRVDASQLATGMYILKISADSYTAYKKVIKI